MGIGALQRLCGDQAGCAAYFEKHHGKAPLFFPKRAEFAVELAGVETCERLLQNPAVDFFLARDDKPLPRTGLDEARRLFDDGYTWVLRDVDKGDSALAELGRSLASDVHGSLHLQMYRSPASKRGFGWHCDPEEVFVLQTKGSKKFFVRENTQHPHPQAEAMPTRLRAEKENTPVQEFTVEAGDALYIPSGWWHAAEALGGESIHISAGILAPSRIDALVRIVAELAKEPRWRERLPAIGRASPLTDEERMKAWSEALKELRDELDRKLTAPDLPPRLFASTGWWPRG